MNAEVTIVIVTWRSRVELADCLTALPPEAEVIVVDNASTDGTVELVRAEFPAVKVLANDRNLGFAVACNQGWRAGSRRFVLLLNPDCRLTADALGELVGALEANPRVAAVAPALVDEEGRPQLPGEPFPAPTLRLDPETRRRPHGEDLGGGLRRAHWTLGACLLLRREALADLGGLDEGYFLYGEDLDLAYRLFRAGHEVAVVPAVTALHLGNRSGRQAPSGEQWQRRFDSYFRYLHQHHGRLASCSVWAVWLIKSALRSLGPGDRTYERQRLRFCLTHLGPLWRGRFGRNHAPDDASGAKGSPSG